MTMRVGLLTAGSDSPGVNAAIRGFGRAAVNTYQMELTGFKDGFAGLISDHTMELTDSAFSGILTLGGTILGTSVSVPHAMPQGNEFIDQTDQAIRVYKKHQLDALVCICDRTAQEAAYKLSLAGLNIITIPKAVDNDIPETDKCIGFDSAREIATQAIDRLHTTANATHRIMIVELLGNYAGWLTLGAGLAAGADVILIPELPYDMNIIVDAINRRRKSGKNFSLIAVAERARSQELVDFIGSSARMRAGKDGDPIRELERLESKYSGQTMLLARRLEESTGLDSHITILGSLVRGGTPTAADRLLSTQLAEWSALMVAEGHFGRMACRQDGVMNSVALDKVAGRGKPIPTDHGWIRGALQVGATLGVKEIIKPLSESGMSN